MDKKRLFFLHAKAKKALQQSLMKTIIMHMFGEEDEKMYVCLCNGVTDRQITALLSEGEKSMRDLRQELKVGTQCGRCSCAARQLVNRFYQISEPSSACVASLYPDECVPAETRQVA